MVVHRISIERYGYNSNEYRWILLDTIMLVSRQDFSPKLRLPVMNVG